MVSCYFRSNLVRPRWRQWVQIPLHGVRACPRFLWSSDLPWHVPDADLTSKMATPWRSLRTSVKKVLKLSPYKPSNVPRQTLPAAEVIEEECTPHYEPNHFYPARLYEILNNRYQITAKLGWGTSSTVWLARDLNQYVLLYR